MNRDKPEFVQARKMLIQDAMDEFIHKKDLRDFSRSAFCAIAKFGLQLDAKREDLFNSEEWSNLECKDELIKKVRKFLVKYLR